VAISGIHTHAGPGGYLQYVVYIVTSLGFVRQSFDVIVDGIEQSIVEAHNNLRPGKIYVNNGIKLSAFFLTKVLPNLHWHTYVLKYIGLILFTASSSLLYGLCI
jgi:hypothetical protein